MGKKTITPEQFEQAKREFTNQYAPCEMRQRKGNPDVWDYAPIEDFISDLTALLEQHKEMMLRKELIKFVKWYNDSYADAMKPHLIVKEYLKNVKR